MAHPPPNLPELVIKITTGLMTFDFVMLIIQKVPKK